MQMASRDSVPVALAETRRLSQQMRASYDVSQETCSIGNVSVSLETLQSNLFSLIEQAKIRIHKATVNQTAPLTEKQAKMLNDAIYSISSILRKEKELATMQKENRSAAVVCGDEFQEQMCTLTKKLNTISIEMAKLKRANDNIMNIYSNYQLENEEECDSNDDETASSDEANDTVFAK
ncbi:uncharacterized protein LOC128743738 [Sabethes cyaneus]|uniref:uncharacterized protein LOC128743738 n=1 Tax=Sabethes cyaneus TaxID=53552 RepID=UPI00237D7FF3|nr:uncharacterized protein LOC128743738 [Sabethes cyaneus]